MRIKIIGENNCARATRHLLRQAGFAVTEFLSAEVITQAPHSGYAITIDLAPAPHTPTGRTLGVNPDPTSKPDDSTHGQPATANEEASPAHGGASSPTALCRNTDLSLCKGQDGPKSKGAQTEVCATGLIHFDSVDSALEAAILRHVTQLAVTPVVVDRPGGVVHSEREVRIVIPRSGNAKADEAAAVAVEFGVLRGLLDLTSPPAPAVAEDKASQGASGGRKKWWMFGIVLLTGSLLALTGSLQASPRLAVNASARGLSASARRERRVVEGRGADGAFLHLEAALAPAQGQFGTGLMDLALIGGAAVSSSLYDSGNTALKVNCVVGCGAASGFSDNAAFTAGSTAVNNISAVFNDSITALTIGNAGALRSTSDRMLYVNLGKLGGTALSGANVVDSGNTAFRVNCVVGCSSSAGFTDNSAFTAGATSESNVGGVFNDGLATLSSGNAAAARITASRALHVNLRNASGAEIGTSGAPIRTDPTGATTQPVSGTFWQATQPVSGTFWQATQPVSIATMPTTPVTGTFWQTTQPVSWSGQSVSLTGSWPYSGALGTVSLTGSLPGFASTPAVSLSGSWPYSGALGTVSLTGTLPAFASTPSVKVTDGANTAVVDPCKGQTKLYASISLTANTQLVTGTSAKKIYICSFHIVTASAENVALVEGTGTVCGTGTAGVGGFGGSSAATGWNFAANGGIAMGNGDSSIGAEGTNANNVCLLVSGSGQKSGGFSYVVQ
ncbi:MAG: hypothetical protein LAN18_01055 [Acidobacteriia bacterium]|nr:hypothetical protein [Terriglobia bacterium]